MAPSLETWADRFCTTILETRSTEPRLLLGYSLGARLALHVLLACPGAWSGAVLVGADTGIVDPKERQRRLAADIAWARRFATEPLEWVLADWNRQPVFAGRDRPGEVADSAFSREGIVHFFDAYSKGRQRDLLPELAAASLPPTLWFAGEEDPAFVAAAERAVAVVKGGRLVKVPSTAHRVPWEAPDRFLAAVAAFAAEVMAR
jgi:2-succinyl-6-hydroxy-2,4-cyclohexadiene-1-carboxylate synthase